MQSSSEDSALEIQKCIDVHDIFVCGEKYKHLSEKPRAIEEIMKERDFTRAQI